MTNRKGVIEVREGQQYELVVISAPETARYRELLRRILPHLERWAGEDNPLVKETREAVRR